MMICPRMPVPTQAPLRILPVLSGERVKEIETQAASARMQGTARRGDPRGRAIAAGPASRSGVHPTMIRQQIRALRDAGSGLSERDSRKGPAPGKSVQGNATRRPDELAGCADDRLVAAARFGRQRLRIGRVRRLRARAVQRLPWCKKTRPAPRWRGEVGFTSSVFRGYPGRDVSSLRAETGRPNVNQLKKLKNAVSGSP